MWMRKGGCAPDSAARQRGALLLALLLATAAAGLGVVFLAAALAAPPQETRTDLSQETGRLFDEVLALLHAHELPESAVSEPRVAPRENERFRWRSHEADIALPAGWTPEGLADLLAPLCAAQGITLTPGEARVSLAAAGSGVRFASLALEQAQGAVRLTDLRPEAYHIVQELEGALRAMGIPAEAIQIGPSEEMQDDEKRWVRTQMQVLLPPDWSAPELAGRLEAMLALRNVSMHIDAGGGTDVLHLMYRERECLVLRMLPQADLPTPAMPAMPAPAPEDLPLDSTEAPLAPPPPLPQVPEGTKPKIALIIDDGGYGGRHTSTLLTLDRGLTLAILPNTPYATEIARLGAERGFEIMLHMPMQTHSASIREFPGQLNVDMDANEIRLLAADALSQLPYVEGVNNHTGSRFTSDPGGMTIFLDFMRERDLYFVDSRTRGSSVAYETALEMRVPTAMRDVFIDNESGHAYIRKQIRHLLDIARSRGHAIGIGHFRPHTVAVLEQELPKIREAGYEIVHVSELLR